MKTFIYAVCAILSAPCICCGQRTILPAGTYVSGDTVTEFKHYADLNSIREFVRVKGRDTTEYRDYYMDSKILHEEGIFLNGCFAGKHRFYSPEGRLEKEIDYNTNIKTLYGKNEEPYDHVLRSVKQHADSLLENKFGPPFTNCLIQNTNQSYHYSNTGSGSWFEVPGSCPHSFLLRYDIQFSNGRRLHFLEFSLDSLGNPVNENEIKSISNLREQAFISPDSFTFLAFKYGLKKEELPFRHEIFCQKSDSVRAGGQILGIKICGKPFKETVHKNVIKQYYNYIILDPWTGLLLKKDSEYIATIVD